MSVYRFAEVAWPTSKRLPCPDCGKKVRRQTKFWQTLNPFNKNAAGQPKTEQEILAELRAEAAEWEQKPEQCTPCRTKSSQS
jgi:hypothetical protein